MTSVIRQLSMKRGNYPNHPLFRIAPILDKGVNFDPYELVLIAKIRGNRYASDLWDCNGFYLNYHDRLDAPADAQVKAVKSRYKLTKEQLEEYRTSPWISEQERARLKAEKAARDAAEAEFARARREYAEEIARKTVEKQRLQAERDAEWERLDVALKAKRERISGETELYRCERAWIVNGPWECSRCLTPSKITAAPGGYVISCRSCGRRAVADHPTLLKVMNTLTLKTQPQPETAGQSP